jgi:hypothetical protein
MFVVLYRVGGESDIRTPDDFDTLEDARQYLYQAACETARLHHGAVHPKLNTVEVYRPDRITGIVDEHYCTYLIAEVVERIVEDFEDVHNERWV